MPYKRYLTHIPCSSSCTSTQVHSLFHSLVPIWTQHSFLLVAPPLKCSPPISLVVSSLKNKLEQLLTGLPAHSPRLNVPSSHLLTNSLHTHTTSLPHNLRPHQEALGSQNSFLTLILSHTQYLLGSLPLPILN